MLLFSSENALDPPCAGWEGLVIFQPHADIPAGLGHGTKAFTVYRVPTVCRVLS